MTEGELLDTFLKEYIKLSKDEHESEIALMCLNNHEYFAAFMGILTQYGKFHTSFMMDYVASVALSAEEFNKLIESRKEEK